VGATDPPVSASNGEDFSRDRPVSSDWRADALAASRHSSFTTDLRMPRNDPDPERARLLCAELCRELLGDYAPALVFLSLEQRRRVQAVVAHTRTLLDFAVEHGFSGERLARINRWEFELEAALAGKPAGQPVFVALSLADAREPWPRPALDELAAVARDVAARGIDLATARIPRPLATAMLSAVTGRPPSPALVSQLATILECELGAGSAASPDLPVSAESLPRSWRRALRYARLVAERRRGSPRPQSRLGVAKRLALLTRAWLGL
jgi:hypothetical protein